jgi:hypothetical protein
MWAMGEDQRSPPTDIHGTQEFELSAESEFLIVSG